jgi:outer membrane cobalamin receptor
MLLIWASLASAQTVVTGTVIDDSGDSLPGVNVTLLGTYDGVSTGPDGKFTFTTTEKGELIINVSYVGYEDFAQTVVLSGDTLHVNPVLKAVTSELDMVVISAGTFEASDEKKAVMLKPLDIVTTAGANADVFSALDKLPGTSTVGESEGLYVRGGSKYETTYIIDEMLVQDPFFSSVPDIPSRGRFSPFQFKGTVFSTGGYSAQYGQALSSAVILNSQDMAEATYSNIGLLPLAWSAGHTQAWEKTSLAAQFGYNNLGGYFKVIPQRTDWVKPPEGINGSFNFRQKTSKTGILKLYATYTQNKMELNYNDLNNPGEITPYNLKNRSAYTNASYRETLNDHWAIFTGVSYSNNIDDIHIATNEINNKNELIHGRVKVSYYFNGHSVLRFGTEAYQKKGDVNFNQLPLDFEDNYAAGFAESDIFISTRLAARIGGRVEYSSMLGKYNVAPRVSLSYKTGTKSQVSFAYGQFYQTPQPEQNSYMYPFYNQSANLNFEMATHYIANYQHMTDKITFRIEGYYKKYNGLIKYDMDSTIAINNTGNGYARGFDLFWRDKKTFKNSDYWISYSFVDSKRNYRAFSESATPTFVAKHNLNIVFKRYFAKLNTTFGASYTYASGRPYFNPNNDQFLEDRTIDYHDFSINASYLTNLWGNFTVIFASVGNVFGFDNIYSYRYSLDGTNREAVRAPALRTVIIGIFIQFKYNKKQNINNN